jgi:hypothetical protein
MERKILL